MKKWFFGFIILLIVAYGVIQYKMEANIGILIEEFEQVQEETPTTGISIRLTREQVYKGNLLLVNKDHRVPPGAEATEVIQLSTNRELINGFALLDNSIRLAPELVQRFSSMVDAARHDGGTRFIITSGYRDESEQRMLYEKYGSESAMPAGYSEHNLGLALDVGSSEGEMANAPEGRWLGDNAWKYGFILRYPKSKTEITGVKYEPWHYRYVGLPHSAIMYEENLVLEEYLDYLKEHKSIATTENGQKYQIFYYPVTKNTKIHVPADGRYEVSGNNMDGIIVTVQSE